MVSRARVLLAGLTGAAVLAAGVGHATTADGSTDMSPPSGEYDSIGFYPGWKMDTTPPDHIDYTAFSTIATFGYYPTSTGEVSPVDISASQAKQQVQAAHSHHVRDILTVGGQGQGSKFVGATSPTNRQAFEQNIKSLLQADHLDGVNLDWEEHVTDHRGQYKNVVPELAQTLSVPVSVDVDPGQVPPSLVEAIQGSVRRVNVMSYSGNGHSYTSKYTRAGITPAKITIGIGVSPSYHDQSRADVAAKVTYAHKHGFAGSALWNIGELKTAQTDPRLVPLRRTLGHGGDTGPTAAETQHWSQTNPSRSGQSVSPVSRAISLALAWVMGTVT
jgi:hypothetical protein